MVNIILSGCGGAMGQAITKAVSLRDDCKIIAGIDPSGQGVGDFPVFSSPSAVTAENPNVIINFSHPASVAALTAFAVERGIPLVEATTGLALEQIALLEDASTTIPVFFSANMSLGVNLMVELAKKAAHILGGQYDIEIIEKHHNQKIDAPSGTALMLADAIGGELDTAPLYVYDRHSKREKRSANEIGIHCIRGGTIVGEHEVIFAGNDEVLTISHSAASKGLFATGAVNAALFLYDKSAKMYSMKDLIDKP